MIVEFRELVAGELTVTGNGPSGAKSPAELFPNLPDMNAVELYEALSDGAAAPDELHDAQARVDATPAQPAPATTSAAVLVDASLADASKALPSTVGVQRSALTATEFDTIYCNPVSGFPIYSCMTNRTNNTGWLLEQQATLMQITVNAYRGNVSIRLQYHNITGWHDTDAFTVNENHTGFILGYGSRKNRRAEVYNATGDGFHRLIHGNT